MREWSPKSCKRCWREHELGEVSRDQVGRQSPGSLSLYLRAMGRQANESRDGLCSDWMGGGGSWKQQQQEEEEVTRSVGQRWQQERGGGKRG